MNNIKNPPPPHTAGQGYLSLPLSPPPSCPKPDLTAPPSTPPRRAGAPVRRSSPPSAGFVASDARRPGGGAAPKISTCFKRVHVSSLVAVYFACGCNVDGAAGGPGPRANSVTSTGPFITGSGAVSQPRGSEAGGGGGGAAALRVWPPPREPARCGRVLRAAREVRVWEEGPPPPAAAAPRAR